MASETLDDPALQSATWDLDPLVGGDGDAGALRDLDEAKTRSDAFAARYAGKIAELDGPGLVEAVDELAAISEQVGKAGTYAGLRFSTDTSDPERGALMQRVQELGTQIETSLIFVGLEWAALDDERAEALLATEGLEHARHYLRMERRYRPHLLSRRRRSSPRSP